MRTSFLISLVVVGLITSCSAPSDTGEPEGVNLEYLTRHWVHSYEERPEGSDVQIYRPEGFKEFPPSRFRMQYIFYRDGDCKWYYLSPVDAHYFRDGTWRFDVEEEDVIHIKKGERTVTYEIVELTEDLLRMVPVTEEAG